MLDRIAGAPVGVRPGKVLKMVENPRMGGSVPAWVQADSATDKIAQNLGTAAIQSPNFKNALAYQMENAPKAQTEEFGFYDLLDIVNPLQHIPLVNIAYRKITGDEIKGAPLVIGGALFGGAAGAAAGIANVIVKEETGKDVANNVFALASGEKIHWKKPLSENPEQRLGDALSGKPPLEDLPVSLLAFTSTSNKSGFVIERQTASQNDDGSIVIAAADPSPYEIY